MTEDEMVGWHHRLNEHEFEQAPEDGEGQGSLTCCSPWGYKESDMTEQQQPGALQSCDTSLYSSTPSIKGGIILRVKWKNTKCPHNLF